MKGDKLDQRIQQALNAEMSRVNTTPEQRAGFFKYAMKTHNVKRKDTFLYVLAVFLLLLVAAVLIIWLKQ